MTFTAPVLIAEYKVDRSIDNHNRIIDREREVTRQIAQLQNTPTYIMSEDELNDRIACYKAEISIIDDALMWDLPF